MKASQKARGALKQDLQNTIKYTKTFIKALAKTIKASVAVLQETVALIIAGGWVAVIIIVIICLAAIVGGMLTGSL